MSLVKLKPTSQITVPPFDKIGYGFYNFKPFEHQLTTILFLLRNKRAYVFNGLGSGKTASAIWAYDILRYTNKVKRMLVIAPLSILETVWLEEVRNIAPHLRPTIMHGPKESRLQALKSNANIVITNHDCVRTYWEEIIQTNFDIIVIDELTAFKHNSSRSRAMRRISKAVKSVWGMTGTPITTGAMDAYGLGLAVNPSKLPTPYMTKFRNMVMYQIDMYNYEHKEGWETVVHNALQPAIRFKTEECIDLPPITFETRIVNMPKETEEAYNNMVKEQLHELKTGTITAVNAGVKFSKLLQIAGGTAIDEEGNIHSLPCNSKLNELISVIQESGNKLIVFCQFVAQITLIERYLKDKKYNVSSISGKVPVSQRAKIFKDFQHADTEVLIAQVSTASHGVTLTSASYILYWTPVMGVEKYVQSIGRVRRAGQSENQHIIKLISCKIEKELYRKLDSGTLTNEDILDMYTNL